MSEQDVAKATEGAAQEAAHSGARDTNDAKRRFLEAFAEIGFVKSACAKCGVGRRTVYDWTKADPEFARTLQDLRDDWADVVEQEVYRRAVEGWEEPVFGRIARDHDGEVGRVKKFSDRLLELLAKANRPEKFRERFELTGKDGGPIETRELSDIERADGIARLLDAARARKAGQSPASEEPVGTPAGPAEDGGGNASI